MAITIHPIFPFIEIGTTLDFAIRGGYHAHPDFFGQEDEWEFRIGGASCPFICNSAVDAMESAEEHLFDFDMDFAEMKLAEAIAQGNVTLALAISERKGFWSGKKEAREEMKQFLLPALKVLETATK